MSTPPGPSFHDLDRRERRRLVAGLAARCSAITIAMFVVYAVIPLRDVSDAGVVVRLVGCMVVFAAVIVWHVRAILQADRPWIRAIEAVVAAFTMLLVTFGYIYVMLATADPANFNQPLDRPTGIYFATTVLATVGFGDVVPVSTSARMIVTVQMVLDLAFIGLVVRVLAGAAQRATTKTEP